MLCCQCKKNQATNIYEKETDGVKSVSYYCTDCYSRLFLSASQHSGKKKSVCSVCGTTEEEFQKTGLVGCASCYQELESCVLASVIGMQGIETHAGKVPKYAEEKIKSERQKNARLSLEMKSLDEALRAGKGGK